MFAVNGGRDPLYPTRVVDPYIDHLKRGGVSIDYHPQPNAAHNTAWWPEVKDTYEAFVREHPRRPLPDTLTWEMGNGAAVNRAHWLMHRPARRAEERGQGAGGSERHADAAVSRLRRPQHRHASQQGGRRVERRAHRAEGGRRAAAAERSAAWRRPRMSPMRSRTCRRDRRSRCSSRATTCRWSWRASISRRSSRRRPSRCSPAAACSGRVDLVRAGNVVTATTRGVAAFTLLLSPDQFDFGKPVKVVANGRTVFDGQGGEERADAAEVRGVRQRPHDALRRRAAHQARLEPAASDTSGACSG